MSIWSDPDRLDDGFGHAEGVHATAEHFDGLGQELGAGFPPRPVSEAAAYAVGAHGDQEHRAAPQVQAQLDLARRFLLQPVQDGTRGLRRTGYRDRGEILGNVIGADRFKKVAVRAAGNSFSSALARCRMAARWASRFTAWRSNCRNKLREVGG